MKKGEKVWWKCSRFDIMVYNAMCEHACFPEEIDACSDRADKPERCVAPVAKHLERRLERFEKVI